jgi:hypothetical protein
MQIIMTGKEMDEAISVWLSSNGFTAQKYDITTKIVVGRGEGVAGTRVECQLEPKPAVATSGVAYSRAMEALLASPVVAEVNTAVEDDVIDDAPVEEPIKVRSPFARD